MTTPPSISHPLVVYAANDGNVWAVNLADGTAYQLTGPGSGIPDAPFDSQIYGRLNGGWGLVPGVELRIDSIQPSSAAENTSQLLDVFGKGFTPTSALYGGTYAIPTTFVDATHLQGQLDLGTGTAGTYAIIVKDGNVQSNSVAFVVTLTGTLFTGGNASCSLDINADGDLIVTQTQGPNAGKSVNLTYGKWA